MALTAGRKEEIARELRVASTWVGGPRSQRLLALALELEGVDAGDTEEKAGEELHRQALDAQPDTPAKEPEKPARKRAAKKTAASQ